MASATEVLDATGMAELVRKKQASPIELLDAAIARADAVNPQINAIVTPLYEQAREAAQGKLPEGPFAGVPFLLKDLQASYRGATLSFGSTFLKNFKADHDSELVARYKRAGLVIFGKTNTPEFGILCTTEPRVFGAARNPWNPERTTGGSSGGSAAAVAAGIVPMAHGNDGGGSIRIPAACCGLFGMKPTRGRITLGPDVGDVMNGLVCEHAITRTVRDSAALLDATEGPMPGDPYFAPRPARPFAQEVGADPGRLKIAFTLKAPTGAPVHADCQAAVREAAALCQELGHHVEETQLPLDGANLIRCFMILWSSGNAQVIDLAAMLTGKKPTPEDFEPLTWALCEMGRKTTAPEYLGAVTMLQFFSRIIGGLFMRYDVLLTPTLAEPPVPLGTFASPAGDPLAGIHRATQFTPFTPVFNVTGQPAMSMPLHWNAEGLPIGTHFIGRYGDEATLFRLAAQLEAARPWAERRPQIFA